MGYGTPFDLQELAGVSPLLNVNDVTEVRLVDCVGDINPAYATYDSLGHIVNAPWPAYATAGSEGFDLAGVGVINAVPEPSTLVLLASLAWSLVLFSAEGGSGSPLTAMASGKCPPLSYLFFTP